MRWEYKPRKVWKLRFALIPTKIGRYWYWLEFYHTRKIGCYHWERFHKGEYEEIEYSVLGVGDD